MLTGTFIFFFKFQPLCVRLTPADTKISAIVPGHGMTDGMALVVEAILTFNLMFVGLVVNDPRKPSILSSAVVGFSIGTGAMAAVSYQQRIG